MKTTIFAILFALLLPVSSAFGEPPDLSGQFDLKLNGTYFFYDPSPIIWEAQYPSIYNLTCALVDDQIAIGFRSYQCTVYGGFEPSTASINLYWETAFERRTKPLAWGVIRFEASEVFIVQSTFYKYTVLFKTNDRGQFVGTFSMDNDTEKFLGTGKARIVFPH